MNAEPILGVRVSGGPADGHDHPVPCAICGQPFDMRDWDQIAHHEGIAHAPFPNPYRLMTTSRLLAETLQDRDVQAKPHLGGTDQ